jgi:hypothetical protein
MSLMPSLTSPRSLPSLAALPGLAALPAVSRRSVGLLLRASAGARASSAAPVTEVWALLAHPERWPEFDPFIRVVEPADGADVADSEGVFEVVAGQRVVAELRLTRRRVDVEVDHVVNRSSLATTVRILPGLAEDVEHLLIPQASGGTLVTVRFNLHGPLALPALLPRWLFRALAVRLLAHAAEGGLRAQSSGIPSVA